METQNGHYQEKSRIVALSGAMLLGLGTLLYSVAVSADLYISPAVRGSVQMDSESRSGQQTGRSDRHGEFVMRERSERFDTLVRYGKNVPLFVAVERIVPSIDSWTVNIDDGLEDSVVSWDGGDSWEEVLRIVGRQNDLFVRISQEERAIGIAKSDHIATHLASEKPNVWRLRSNLSMRENLSDWAKSVGWSLAWNPSQRIDFPIEHDATLTGDFIGQDGVVSQILQTLENSRHPLRAEFHRGNNVLVITDAGFKQEVMY